MPETDQLIEEIPTLSEVAGQAWRETRDELRSDMGIHSVGTFGGLALGTVLAYTVEGLPIKPTEAQVKAEMHGPAAKDGAPAMVHANAEQVGTIAGLSVAGLVAAVAYTSIRARRNAS